MAQAGAQGVAGAPNPPAAISCESKTRAISAGGVGEDDARGVTVDAEGAAYVAGYISAPAVFGGSEIRPEGRTDAYLAKYASDGALQWLKRLGGAGEDAAYAVAVAGGAVYVAGVFDHRVLYDGTAFTPSPERRWFLGKFSSAGSSEWMRELRAVDDAAVSITPRGLAVAADGSAYVVGEFEGAWSWDGHAITAQGPGDIFVAHFNPAGVLDWARRAGGLGFDGARGVAVIADGSAYVTGSYLGEGPYEEGRSFTTVSRHFLAKYGADGRLHWAKMDTREEAAGSSEGYSVATIPDGSVYVAGSLSGSVAFDDGAHAAVTSDGSNVFLAKYAGDGSVLWVRAGRSDLGAQSAIYAVAALPNASVYLVGGSLGGVQFGGHRLGNIHAWTMFMGRVRGDGEVSWVRESRPFNPSDSSTGRAVAVRDDCIGYVAGAFVNTWSIDGASVTARGSSDAFLVQFGPH